jgi:integrase
MVAGTNSPLGELKANAQGYFEIHWSEKGRSKRFSCRTKDPVEAQRTLKEWRAEAAQVQALARSALVPSVEEVCQRFLEHATREGKTNSSRYALVPVQRELGHFPADTLTMENLQHYRDRRTVSDSSVRRELTQLRAVLRWAVKRKLIEADTLPRFDEMPPESTPRLKWMDDAEADYFWSQAMLHGQRDDLPQQSRAAARRVMVFVALAMETAARRGAIYRLTWDRVDFTSKLIDYRVPGERLTKKRKVTVKMSDRVRTVLETAAQDAPKNVLGRPVGRVLGEIGCVRRAFREFAEAIKMPWVTPHVLRHTWASQSARLGYPMKAIAEVLGDSVETVNKYYVHLTPDYQTDIVNRKRAA